MKSITHFWGDFTKLINSWGHKKDWNKTWKIQITHPLHEKDLDPIIRSKIGDKKGSFHSFHPIIPMYGHIIILLGLMVCVKSSSVFVVLKLSSDWNSKNPMQNSGGLVQ